MNRHLYFSLYLLIVFHFVVVLINAAAFIFLSIDLVKTFLLIKPYYSLYISFPILTFIFHLALEPGSFCPLTRLENKIRKRLNLPEIKGFISYYILRNRKCP